LGSTFYINDEYTFTDASFTLYINNLNTQGESYKSFTIKLIMDVIGNSPYPDTIYLSSDSNNGTSAITPLYLGGNVSSSVSSEACIQTFRIVYKSGVWKIFAKVEGYYSNV
jgi:hypothetical protein